MPKHNKKREVNAELSQEISENILKRPRLTIKPYNLTPKQKDFVKLVLNPDTKIVFISGPSGSSKSFLAVYSALRLLIENQDFKIRYVRTAIESANRSLGYMPGNLVDKFSVFLAPLYDKLDELITPDQSKALMEDGSIEAIPVNFLRGTTFKNQVIIADEAQCFTSKELITLLTRTGEGCKMIIAGDPEQSDIKNSGFVRVFNLFDNEESQENGIFTRVFDEDQIMRSKVLRFIVKKFKLLEKH